MNDLDPRLRAALMYCLGAAFTMLLFALVVTRLTGGSASAWPGLTPLYLGALTALGGAGACLLALARGRRGADPAGLRAGLGRTLRHLARFLLGALALALAAWLVAGAAHGAAHLALGTAAFSPVAAQVAGLLWLARRRLA